MITGTPVFLQEPSSVHLDMTDNDHPLQESLAGLNLQNLSDADLIDKVGLAEMRVREFDMCDHVSDFSVGADDIMSLQEEDSF
jgi:hypothetical protein